MKANELRIGNWVRFKGYLIEEQQVTEIKSIGDNSHVEPIFLTEEWLLRFDWNGYKQFCINSYFSIDTKGCLWYCGDFTGIVVEHVHQLQNLYFALTGKELTIKEP